MTLCFCLSTLHHGGAERVAATICNTLCSRHKIFIILLSGKSTQSAYFIDDKVCVISLEKENQMKLKRFKKVAPLSKLFKRIKPDAVISFLPFVNVICHYACKKAKILHITSERNDPRIDPKNIILRKFKEFSIKRSDGLVCQTEEAFNYYEKKGVKNLTIISNPLFLSKLVQPPFAKERKKQIVFAGRLEPQKNVPLLLSAFKIVNETHKDYSLLIFGEGREKNGLVNFVKNNNIRNVEFRGLSKEWHAVANESRLFVLSSLYEGMPNSLLEAMCLCVPCVSTMYSETGPRFIIDDGINGLICKQNDPNALALCINSLIESDTLCDKFSKNNIELYKQYDTKTISNAWELFIADTINSERNK